MGGLHATVAIGLHVGVQLDVKIFSFSKLLVAGLLQEDILLQLEACMVGAWRCRMQDAGSRKQEAGKKSHSAGIKAPCEPAEL
jgi:hypothetical protein